MAKCFILTFFIHSHRKSPRCSLEVGRWPFSCFLSFPYHRIFGLLLHGLAMAAGKEQHLSGHRVQREDFLKTKDTNSLSLFKWPNQFRDGVLRSCDPQERRWMLKNYIEPLFQARV